MKVKIKSTGKIANVSDRTKITLDIRDIFGNPIELELKEVEFIQDKMEDEHWQIDDITDWDYYRIHAAIAAMQGTITILSSNDRTAFRDIVVEGFCGDKKTYPNEIAEFAIACANSLIKELKRNYDETIHRH